MNSLLRLTPSLYESLFWLSVALAPTLAAIYALSVSMLGSAITVARTAATRMRRSVGAEIEALKSSLSKGDGGKSGIKETERQLRRLRTDLASAENAARSISLRSTVILPAALFLVTAFLARLPLQLTAAQQYPHPLWLLILAPFCVGLWVVGRVLRTIRSVVELSIPDLEVTVDRDPDPWGIQRFHKVRIKAILHKGNALPATQLVLFLPPSCELRGTPIWTVSADDPVMPGYKAVGSTVWDYKPLAPFEWEFHHLEPRAKGPMTMYYAVYGQTLSTEPRPIRVNVE